jgi:hypothetical protein
MFPPDAVRGGQGLVTRHRDGVQRIVQFMHVSVNGGLYAKATLCHAVSRDGNDRLRFSLLSALVGCVRRHGRRDVVGHHEHCVQGMGISICHRPLWQSCIGYGEQTSSSSRPAASNCGPGGMLFARSVSVWCIRRDAAPSRSLGDEGRC